MPANYVDRIVDVIIVRHVFTTFSKLSLVSLCNQLQHPFVTVTVCEQPLIQRIFGPYLRFLNYFVSLSSSFFHYRPCSKVVVLNHSMSPNHLHIDSRVIFYLITLLQRKRNQTQRRESKNRDFLTTFL